jgi:hypothetical protein
MIHIGFSTGALYKAEIAKGVAASRTLGLHVIELSALRIGELPNLVSFVESDSLAGFAHVSVHAPTDYPPEQERWVAGALLSIARSRGWVVVVHPDCIKDPSLWTPFQHLLGIENMDTRKSTGRTLEELGPIFNQFPSASLCFDIAHAYQVDTSMTEAFRILRAFRGRIVQLHVSEVTSSGKHARISNSAVRAYREVVHYLPHDVPVILETPVTRDEASREVRQTQRVFEAAHLATSA